MKSPGTGAGWKRLIGNSALVVASVLIALLVGEAGLRLASGVFSPRMMQLGVPLGWQHTPNISKRYINESGQDVLVVQNRNGHRGLVREHQKSQGKTRVLVLGDSYTEGAQVDEKDVFTALMEKADPRLEVLNAGVGGYGTVQQYLYLASEGLRFQPDVVLLMFYENDLSDNVLSYYPGFGPRPYAVPGQAETRVVDSLDMSDFKQFILPVPLQTFLHRHSYLYYVMNSRIYQPAAGAKLAALHQNNIERVDRDTKFEVFFHVVDKVKGLLAQRGIPLMVVVIPTRADVTAGRSDTAERIRQHCAAVQLNCLALIDRFAKERDQGPPLNFARDIHWTVQGHRIAADEIMRQLRLTVPVINGAPELITVNTKASE